nr:unnamed protein product [Digitaria exilis]
MPCDARRKYPPPTASTGPKPPWPRRFFSENPRVAASSASYRNARCSLAAIASRSASSSLSRRDSVDERRVKGRARRSRSARGFMPPPPPSAASSASAPGRCCRAPRAGAHGEREVVRWVWR